MTYMRRCLQFHYYVKSQKQFMAATTWKRKCICLYSDDSLHNLRLYIRCRKRRFLRRSVSWYIAVLFCSGLSYYILLSAFFERYLSGDFWNILLCLQQLIPVLRHKIKKNNWFYKDVAAGRRRMPRDRIAKHLSERPPNAGSSHEKELVEGNAM